jgi:hypothetical protein
MDTSERGKVLLRKAPALLLEIADRNADGRALGQFPCNNPRMSSAVHTLSASPAAIAGVTFRFPWLRVECGRQKTQCRRPL